MTRRSFVAAGLSAATALAQRPTRSQFGVCVYSYHFKPVKDTLEFIERCHGLGAAGVQTPMTSFDADYIGRVKRRSDELNMYVELVGPLPRTDVEPFTRIIEAARSLGNVPVRIACLGGRRYETFSTLEDWKNFVTTSKAGLARAIPIADKAKVPLAIENHKDWTLDEMVPLLKSYSSEYAGVCIDTGNNISLLDDPVEVVQKLAPFAITTHIKDMGVQEYPDGFLLSEVASGKGFLDLRSMIATIRAAKPKIRLNIEMITRNPLKIPCLTDKYWATFPDRNGSYLARMLRTVKQHNMQLPVIESLSPEAQAQAEEDNVKASLAYA